MFFYYFPTPFQAALQHHQCLFIRLVYFSIIHIDKLLLLLLGEDRWLCTLMVQAGWRLDYCAAAEDSTFCPDNFDEFFKQRRRWIPSTLANLLLLISQWKVTVSNNDCISFAFILYQALLVFSTIIGCVGRSLFFGEG